MRGFGTQIAISAPAETIWSLLTNATEYPRWNSTVAKIDGRIALGEKLTLHAKASSSRAFPLRVTVFEKPARMVWSGGMPLGLLTGTRTFTLTPTAGGEVLFSMEETFTGLLAWLITRLMGKMLPAFHAFAADLKRAAEAGD